jgi:PPP family 3-phenylpropionic acid transporter
VAPRAEGLPRFILLYAALYAGFGVASPFFPSFLSERGVPAAELGLVLGAATAVRLLASPLAGRVADLAGNLRAVLSISCALAAAAALNFLPAQAFWPLVAVVLLHAAALAPTTVLADALSVRRRFEYGWVRGTGSAAFIAGLLVSGQLVQSLGLDTIVFLQAILLGTAVFTAARVPEIAHDRVAPSARRPAGGVVALLRIPVFVNLVVVAALILGSHAMHDAFAVIRWREAGISPATASLLWSASVAAEVVVFFLVGPALVSFLTPAGAIALAGLAGIVRWAVMAHTTDLAPLWLVQPLHGFTFALLHLACMRLIARTAPPGLEATTQAIYGIGVGGTTALLTMASGALYASAGARGFWVMAMLCALALPLAANLRRLTSSRAR